MVLLLTYLAFMILGDIAAYLIGLVRRAGLADGQSAGLSRVLFPLSVDLVGHRGLGHEALGHAGAGCRLILPIPIGAPISH